MPKTFTVYSPVEGAVVPLEQVPDPVFSEHMLGDGLAVDPGNDTVYAPFDGKVISVTKESHALVLGKDGAEILIHVGLETVNLKGEGFTSLVQAGETVQKGQPLLKFDPSVLAAKAPCSFVIVVVTTPAETTISHKAEGLIKVGTPLFEIPCANAAEETPSPTDFLESDVLTVINPNGLHARPAGVLAQMALKYPFAVEIVKGDQRANAKSVVGVMGLSLAYRDQVVIRAAGPEDQAKALLVQLATGFKEGFGEKGAAPMPSIASAPSADQPTALSACAGLAYGKAFLYHAQDIFFEEQASADPIAEKKQLDDTLQAVILETQSKISTEKNEETKTILSAHLSILQDPEMLQTAHKAVANGKSAAYGISEAIRNSISVLQNTGNAFLMERAADLKDLRRALLLRLGGKKQDTPNIPEGSILIAEELLPSEVSALAGQAAGVLLAYGSPTAHASIMLRNMGIPSIVRAGAKVLSVASNATICLDADQATYLVNPDAAEQARFQTRLEKNKQERQAQQQTAHEKAVTKDGIQIWVEGNVANEKEASQSVQNGADGLGLVRSEFLFHGRSQSPSESEQRAAYQAILEAAQGRPVTLRTLDAGGDKPLPFVQIPPEDNPIVGIRGIRAFKRNESFFRTQLRAMLSVGKSGNLRIMLPMVAFTEEVDFFKQVIAEEKDSLGIKADIKIGIMVEVPSAALISSQMAARADFFSIGTNDLTQYTLAIDRGHKELSALSDSLHPAVLKLISLTCQGAKENGKPVAVCGAMAGDLMAVPLLIGLGVTELAVGAASIAPVKALVRRLDSQKCKAVAQKTLALASAQEVRALVRTEFGV